jgi:Tol biopolymer transport system component
MEQPKMQMTRILLVSLILFIISLACSTQAGPPPANTPPTPIPSGILIQEIPSNMDIIFDSIRYVLNDMACLDENYQVDKNFLNIPECNAIIYDAKNDGLASPRQLFAMDLESREVVQITNTECAFLLGQVVDSTRLMTWAACSDTDNNGQISEKDKTELYLFKLPSGEMDCLTCGYDLTSINNPDYSQVNSKIVFSAQHTTAFHNYLFTIDLHKNLAQITNQTDYMDFDCAWSEDGSKIVFNRLEAPWLTKPSQIWLMDSDGNNLEKITEGGPNPHLEENHGLYPIGIDADPDLSPDNQKIVFSRLKTGKENIPFGVFELIVIDVDTKAVEVLDSQYANMVPQWKSGGILINRQVGVVDANEISATNLKQSLYVYRDGIFEELEASPYNVFPLGAYGGYWIEP